LGGCAFAQESAHVIGVGGEVHYFGMQMGPGDKVVKGAPYSADAVTETVQTLANGTRITHQTTAQLARDSEGRTRREQTLDAVGPVSTSGEAPKFIMLNDPVAGVSYHLDPKTNTAMKMHALRGELSPPQVERHVFVAGDDGPEEQAVIDKMKAEKMATAVITAGGVAVRDEPMAVLKAKERGEEKTEALGKQSIEGVEVTGTRTTRTIAAGAIGNDQPIEIVSETWYSPDLHMVIMSKHSDPQIGETTYKLTNIVQAEPAHSLFEVPANYTIRGGEKQIILDSASGAPNPK